MPAHVTAEMDVEFVKEELADYADSKLSSLAQARTFDG
jgi:hypothetical protein